VLVTANWAPVLISALASNPAIPNFGVAGPFDTNNDKIFTHAFAHRTHIEVRGRGRGRWKPLGRLQLDANRKENYLRDVL